MVGEVLARVGASETQEDVENPIVTGGHGLRPLSRLRVGEKLEMAKEKSELTMQPRSTLKEVD